MPGRKYTLEERLEVVMHYLASDEGYRLNSARFNVPRTQVRIWVEAYDAYGEEGLRPRDKSVSIDPEIRIEAVKVVLSGQMSRTKAAKKFNVAGASPVAKWIKVFNEQGEEGLRSLKVGTKSVSYMAEHPELIEASEERSKEQQIHELGRKVKRLELRILYLQKLKALVR
ncbi:transposase [Leclercia sp.]|jgi:transposase|uniref:transposase n=1 Tax=Leclercia sp. TaxID=1898428 RepID=UPI00289654E2|nr:transposase [Leclercia sp.]